MIEATVYTVCCVSIEAIEKSSYSSVLYSSALYGHQMASVSLRCIADDVCLIWWLHCHVPRISVTLTLSDLVRACYWMFIMSTGLFFHGTNDHKRQQQFGVVQRVTFQLARVLYIYFYFYFQTYHIVIVLCNGCYDNKTCDIVFPGQTQWSIKHV